MLVKNCEIQSDLEQSNLNSNCCLKKGVFKPTIDFMGFYSMGFIEKHHEICMGLMRGSLVARIVNNKYIGNYLKHFIFSITLFRIKTHAVCY